MKKFLLTILLLTFPIFIFSKDTIGLSFGPSISYYHIGNDDIFSNELGLRIAGSNEILKKGKVQYALSFYYPAFCFVGGENSSLINRLTDLSVEVGLSYQLPINSRVEMALGSSLSYYMGARPLSSGERVYQYGLNLDLLCSTLFDINPVFGITLDLRASAPLYLYSAGSTYKKHSSMTGLSVLGSVGFVYLYN